MDHRNKKNNQQKITKTPTSTRPSLSIWSANIRGLRSNFLDLSLLVSQGPPDIICLSETFLSDDVPDSVISLPGYSLFRRDRGSFGGGILVYFRSDIGVSLHSSSPSHEYVWLRLNLSSHILFLCCVYHPPSSDSSIFDSLLDDSLHILASFSNPLFLLTGDFNCPGVPWIDPTCGVDSRSLPVLSFANSLLLTQIVDFPTHVSPNGHQSLLDLFMVDFPEHVSVSDSPPIGSSDHHLLRASVNIPVNLDLPASRRVWHYQSADWDGLRIALASSPWTALFPPDSDVNCWASNLSQWLTDLMECYIPFSYVSKSHSSKPWFDDECLSAVAAKDHYFNLYKLSPSPSTFNVFKRYRNHCTTVLRRAHARFNSQLISRLKSAPNNKSWWHLAKSLTGFESSSRIPSLVKDGTSFDSAVDKASLLNDYFASVCSVVNDSKPISVPFSPSPSISSVLITPRIVFRELSSLDISVASGPDGISAKVLKMCAPELAAPLSKMFNFSLSSSVFPSCWKLASVVPIHKKGSRSDPTNYRPVSLLCIISKVFESIVSSSIHRFLLSTKFFSPFQFGFRPGLSTLDALLYMHHHWSSALNEKSEVRVISLDFRRAFDTVWHRGLLAKLHQAGIVSDLLNWISSYLSGRHQFVVIDGHSSTSLPVLSGVPQGSVLGPLFFIVFINDLLQFCNNHICCYADDTTLFARVPPGQRHAVAKSLNNDLSRIHSWASDWLLDFNIAKCSILTISRSPSRSLNPPLFLGSTCLPEVDYLTLLGVTFSSNLSWSRHINSLAVSASRRLGLLLRSSRHVPRSTLFILFKSLVRSLLDYCSPLWFSTFPTVLSPLLHLQSRAVNRLGFNFTLQKIIDPLPTRWAVSSLSVYYKYIHSSSSATSYLLPPLASYHYASRSSIFHQVNRSVPSSRLALHSRSFFPYTTRMWNCLPLVIKQSSTLTSFKSSLYHFLLSNPNFFTGLV